MSNTIQEVKAKHEAELMQTPGVVSVGIGLAGSEKVIIIGVENEKTVQAANLPRQLEGYPVHIKVTGKISAQ